MDLQRLADRSERQLATEPGIVICRENRQGTRELKRMVL